MPGRRLRRSPRRRRPYAEATPSRGSSTGNSWLCRLDLSPPMGLSCLHCVASGLESQACPKGPWASSSIRLPRIGVVTPRAGRSGRSKYSAEASGCASSRGCLCSQKRLNLFRFLNDESCDGTLGPVDLTQRSHSEGERRQLGNGKEASDKHNCNEFIAHRLSTLRSNQFRREPLYFESAATQDQFTAPSAYPRNDV